MKFLSLIICRRTFYSKFKPKKKVIRVLDRLSNANSHNLINYSKLLLYQKKKCFIDIEKLNNSHAQKFLFLKLNYGSQPFYSSKHRPFANYNVANNASLLFSKKESEQKKKKWEESESLISYKTNTDICTLNNFLTIYNKNVLFSRVPFNKKTIKVEKIVTYFPVFLWWSMRGSTRWYANLIRYKLRAKLVERSLKIVSYYGLSISLSKIVYNLSAKYRIKHWRKPWRMHLRRPKKFRKKSQRFKKKIKKIKTRPIKLFTQSVYYKNVRLKFIWIDEFIKSLFYAFSSRTYNLIYKLFGSNMYYFMHLYKKFVLVKSPTFFFFLRCLSNKKEYVSHHFIWFLRSFFFKEPTSSMLIVRQNSKLSAITKLGWDALYNFSFFLKKDFFHKIKKFAFWKSDFITDWFWLFIGKLVGFSCIFSSYKKKVKSLFYYVFLKIYSSSNTYTENFTRIIYSQNMNTDLIMGVSAFIKFDKKQSKTRFYLYQIRVNKSILNLLDSIKHKVNQNPNYVYFSWSYLVNISRWYVNQFFFIDKKNKNRLYLINTDFKLTFFGETWWRFFNMFRSIKYFYIVKILKDIPRYLINAKRLLKKEKPFIWSDFSVRGRRIYLKRWEKRQIIFFYRFLYKKLQFVYLKQYSFFKLKGLKTDFHKISKKGMNKNEGYIYDSYSSKKFKAHTIVISRIFFLSFWNYYFFVLNKLSFGKFKFVFLDFDQLVNFTSFQVSSRLTKIWGSLYYKKNFYSSLLPIFFARYKEISFRIKTATLLLSILQDLHYIKPDWNKNQFKLILAGLYRHY